MTISQTLVNKNGKPTAVALGPSLVFQPGGVTSGNVYATWDALAAVGGTIQGPYKIFTDGTFAPGDGNVHIPAGSWDLGPEVTFQSDASSTGNPNTIGAPVIFDDGATLVYFPVDHIDIAIANNSTSPVVTNSTTENQVFYASGVTYLTGGTAALYQLTSPGAVFSCFLHDVATLGAPLAIDAPNVVVYLNDAATVQPYAINATSSFAVRNGGSGVASYTQSGGGTFSSEAPNNQALFVSTGDATINNTTGPTSFVPVSYVGTMQQWSTLQNGALLRLDMQGLLSTSATPPTIQIQLSLGGIVFVDTLAQPLPPGLTSAPWRMNVIIVNSVLGPEFLTVQAFFEYQPVNPGPLTCLSLSTPLGGMVAVTDGLLDALVTWSAADPANSIDTASCTLAIQQVQTTV